MKSTKEDLIKRGYFYKSDLENYLDFNENELNKLLKSEIPQERAIAINLLSSNNSSNKYTLKFLNLLKTEKKLYVRLEIAKTLEKGNIETAKLMITYLGKIPNKQYKKLPKKISTKKTYLIPRDLIGRMLSKMNITIFPLVLELLYSQNQEIISESLDIFGFMIFHNQELASSTHFNYLTKLLDLWQSNDLILWKIVMATSAFRQNYSIDFLMKIKNISNNDIINQEINRSINLINNYK